MDKKDIAARAILFVAWPFLAVLMVFAVVLVFVIAWPLTLTNLVKVEL